MKWGGGIVVIVVAGDDDVPSVGAVDRSSAANGKNGGRPSFHCWIQETKHDDDDVEKNLHQHAWFTLRSS